MTFHIGQRVVYRGRLYRVEEDVTTAEERSRGERWLEIKPGVVRGAHEHLGLGLTMAERKKRRPNGWWKAKPRPKQRPDCPACGERVDPDAGRCECGEPVPVWDGFTWLTSYQCDCKDPDCSQHGDRWLGKS